MGKMKDLFRRELKVSEEKKAQFDNNYEKKTYTFSSIFPTEEIMERCMDTIRKLEDSTISKEKTEVDTLEER